MNLTHVGPGKVADFIEILNMNFDIISSSEAIDSASLASNAVTSTKISDGAVTTAKIDDDSITAGKLKDNIISVGKINTSGSNLSEWKEFIGNLMYPVGSYYWSSTQSTSPSELFGGTWTQITNRFLFAAGGSYSVNSMGGESTVVLTTSQMPSHTHEINDGEWHYYTRDQSQHGDAIHVMAGTRNTLASGGGQAHNNMPPYLVAYCWRRTA